MKVSVIMQAYLGEYPGSRSDSNKKFIRAVQSFIDQDDKDSELIIVSDSCDIVHGLYHKLYKQNERIKYIYVDKDTPNMYEGEEKYYRGLPRQVGRSLVTGEITTYMDSDDFLLGHAISSIKSNWSIFNEEVVAVYNSSWIDNAVTQTVDDMNTASVECCGEEFTIDSLGSTWINRRMTHKTLVLSSTWAMIHASDFEGKWEDTIGDPSEDVKFSYKLQATKKVGVMNEPYYVRCHYSKLWDY